MPQNRKDPSNQCIPSASDIPRCSLRFRGKRSRVMLAKGTLAWRWGALSQHLLPSESDPASTCHCHHESSFMTPEDVICGRRREHSSTGLYIRNRPTKKPAQSKVWDFSMALPLLFTPELQTGGGPFQEEVLENRTNKGQKQVPLLLRGFSSACILQCSGAFLIPGCTSWNPGLVAQSHCHNFPRHSPDTDPPERRIMVPHK